MTRVINTCNNIERNVNNMKSYSPKEVIEILLRNGWYEKRSRGSHFQFENRITKKMVTVSISKKKYQ